MKLPNPIYGWDVPEPPEPWTPLEQRVVALWCLVGALVLVWACVA